MLKTYTENNFSICSSLGSHYAEVWQAEFMHWIFFLMLGYLLWMKSGQGVLGIYQATPITPIPFFSAGWEDAISKPGKAASQGSFSDSWSWSNDW